MHGGDVYTADDGVLIGSSHWCPTNQPQVTWSCCDFDIRVELSTDRDRSRVVFTAMHVGRLSYLTPYLVHSSLISGTCCCRVRNVDSWPTCGLESATKQFNSSSINQSINQSNFLIQITSGTTVGGLSVQYNVSGKGGGERIDGSPACLSLTQCLPLIKLTCLHYHRPSLIQSFTRPLKAYSTCSTFTDSPRHHDWANGLWHFLLSCIIFL